jgi:hypothetical protein
MSREERVEINPLDAPLSRRNLLDVLRARALNALADQLEEEWSRKPQPERDPAAMRATQEAAP